jgi:hypothetical protein
LCDRHSIPYVLPGTCRYVCAVCTFFLRSVRRHIGPRTLRIGGGVWMDKKNAHLGALTPAEPAAPLLDIVER